MVDGINFRFHLLLFNIFVQVINEKHKNNEINDLQI